MSVPATGGCPQAFDAAQARLGAAWAGLWAGVAVAGLLTAVACSSRPFWEVTATFADGQSLSGVIPVEGSFASEWTLRSVRVISRNLEPATTCFGVWHCNTGGACQPMVDKHGHEVLVSFDPSSKRMLLESENPIPWSELDMLSGIKLEALDRALVPVPQVGGRSATLALGYLSCSHFGVFPKGDQ